MADRVTDKERAPDAVEAPSAPTLVVGIGASAGGVKALREFFAAVPVDTGVAYVVILHLSPNHESQLAEVLQSATSLPVAQVTEQVAMVANHVYVVPPNKSLTVAGNTLALDEITGAEQRRAPIDLFFRTLAEAHGPRCVAVILSGTGADGANGLKRVKEHGGLAIAQEPGEAEYPDMPNSAIATGLVDVVLQVARIPTRIQEFQGRLDAAEAHLEPLARNDGGATALKDVLTLLRTHTRQDFSLYKQPTVLRRIGRRISLHNLASLEEYADFMRRQPEEADALMKELLISVTNFFRDPDAFAVLEERVIPRLFEQKQHHDQVRAWVAGCATGEEAYSIAMLLAEHAATLTEPPAIQVFATDLDAAAISIARDAFYAQAELVDVSEQRLQRFFQRERNGYRVRRELRELVLFARHNVTKDPPFSHLDLAACRNLMIYLNRPTQARLIETFHFALRPGGCLFLGSSELPDAGGDLFVPIDKSSRVYESRSVMTRTALPLTGRVPGPAPVPSPPDLRLPDRLAPGDLHHRLLEQYAAPSLVVTDALSIVHVSESAARFLQMAAGEPSRDVLKLIRPDLRAELRTALYEAGRQRANVEVRVIAAADGARLPTSIIVRPVLRDGEPARGFFLVLFEEHTGAAPAGTVPISTLLAPPPRHHEEELSRMKDQLRVTVEQYESQVEEVKAANEELQATNEELRSAAEELETSKEELQSVNEELITVNEELKIKIEELGLTNNDFQNFINSTDIGTIFLDRSLRVKLSTPRARDVFNLLPSDNGRLLSDITSTLLYDGLAADVQDVLQRLQVVERDVRTTDGKWLLMRLLPYRTTDDHIEGVVLTFLDISRLRLAESRIRLGEERLRLLIDSAIDYAIFTMTREGEVDSWNTGAQRMFGYPAADIVGRSAAILFTPEDQAAGVPAGELEQARRIGRAEDERFHMRKDGSHFYCSGVTTSLGEAGALGFAKIARDLTAQRQAEESLKDAQATLEDRVRDRTVELQAEVAQRSAAQQHAMNLLRKLVTSQEDQRARIARDLHDHLGQQLTALRLTLERHRAAVTPEPSADSDLDRAQALARQIDDELDFLAWELRPAALDDLGLGAALPQFLGTWSKHHGVAAQFRSSEFTTGRLSREAEVTCYRITQEALNNVIKHAHATRVDVILEHRDGAAVLVIEDDGVGFDPADRVTSDKGLGLVGMRERAALIGAALDIESAPGNGTTIYLRCPLHR